MMPNQSASNSCLGKKPLCFIAKCDALWHGVSFGSFQVSSPGCVPSQPLALLTAGGKVTITGWVRFKGTTGGHQIGCLLKQGSLDHLTGDCDQSRDGDPITSEGNPFQCLVSLTVKFLCSGGTSVFQFLPIASCPVLGHHGAEVHPLAPFCCY